MPSHPPDLASSSNRLIDAASGAATTWAELPHTERVGPTAVGVGASFDALPWVRGHALRRGELLICAASRLDESLRAELLADGFSVVVPGEDAAPPAPRQPVEGRLWLLTSGTTGRPKRVGHTLESLTTVSTQLAPRRWLCPYSPGTYAWWQLVTLSAGLEGQDLVVTDPSQLRNWVEAAIDHQVTAVSGTPTFWRQSMLENGSELARVPLEQITLGGEPVDQSVLDQLRTLFPEARVTWIYASSELGASIVVHDGKAGFPVEWLERGVEGRPRISIEAGELVIDSPHHGAEYSGSRRTGDAVAIENGRVHITGRLDSDEINVGGSKVSVGAIRDVLQAHPDVAWARPYGRGAPVVGKIVAADVVLKEKHADPATIRERLRSWCAERLPDHGTPRFIRVLEAIPTTETLKSGQHH